MEKAQAPLLEIKNITKRFAGITALNDISINVTAGSVHAVVGENGAGKSTLMKCLFGIYRADSGLIYLDDRKVEFKSPREALKNGVCMVHQEQYLALSQTVSENLWLGRYPSKAGVIRKSELLRKTKEIFSALDINIDPEARVSSLTPSEREILEIAKAVSYGARIVIFDEPTSSLTREETEHLFRMIKQLKWRGCAVIFISHKLEEVLRVADTVTILRDGQLIETRPAASLSISEMIRLMAGREISERYPQKKSAPGDIIFEVANLSGRTGGIKNISFTLRRGEILGVAGLEGSGKTELLETVFGYRKPSAGSMRLLGSPVKNATPKKAIKNGFALIAENRRAKGILGSREITENTVIAGLRKYLKFGIALSYRDMQKDTEKIREILNIKGPESNKSIDSLSGGGQQKVIIGRWLLTKPKIFLLDEPTHGIDAGSKFEIYRMITELSEGGAGMIMASSELPELLGLCDRIMVLSAGRLAGIVDSRKTCQEEILFLAAKYV